MVNKSIPRRILKRNINYGFLTADKLPREEFKERNLTDRFSWSTTEEFKNMAKNHCATVCATNLALYFEVTRDNPHKIFREIYKYMGDGPKIKVEGAMKRYFRDLGYDLKLEKIRRRDEIKKSLDEGKPIILLLAGSLVNWHWVLVTGYKIYEDEIYLRIVDGWNKRGRTYYKPDAGSKILFAGGCELNRKTNY